ncbi:MAG: ABC transporter permease [Acidobacteriaceae bacterium]
MKFSNLGQDLRYALRQLRGTPIFTVTAVLMLALGIGANTAIFSLIDRALLRSLPVAHPGELVHLIFTGRESGTTYSWDNEKTDHRVFFSYPTYRDLRHQSKAFQGLLATTFADITVNSGGQAARATGELVSGNYFTTLGLKPAMGRLFVSSDETQANANPVAVLSFAYWQQHFGMNPNVVGKAIRISSHPFTVVGVAPPNFRSIIGGNTPDVFVPLTMEPEIMPSLGNTLPERNTRWFEVLGRLKPGENRAQSQASLQSTWANLRRVELASLKTPSTQLQQTFLKSTLELQPAPRGVELLGAQIEKPLTILGGMVLAVLLLMCLNLAGLFLVRAAGRAKEVAVRCALGAPRWQLVRQFVLEGVVLGLAGGALATVLAPMLSHWLMQTALASNSPTGELPFSASLDLRMLAFNFGIAFLASVLFSLAPALQFAQPDLNATLGRQKSVASAHSSRARRGLVVLQLAFGLVLLVAAGLFTRTLYNLRNAPLGYVTDHVLMFNVDPQMAGYTAAASPNVDRRLLDSLAAQPGVRSVALTSMPLLGDDNSSANVTVAGHKFIPGEDTNANFAEVSGKYFSTIQAPLLAGRLITGQDTATSEHVAVVNEKFARHYFGDPRNAIGHEFGFGNGDGTKLDIRIVGIVRDGRTVTVRSDAVDTVYIPFQQWDQPHIALPVGGMMFYVRTWEPPTAAMSGIRGAVRNVDPNLAIEYLQTMEEQLDQATQTEQMISILALCFGGLATLLAALGLYGMLAYATAQRTQEIGIRMALGADRGSVLRMVLREVLVLAVWGIGLALPTALLLARPVETQLYGMSSEDPFTYVAAAVILALVASIAGLIPARRAANVDPMEALRAE